MIVYSTCRRQLACSSRPAFLSSASGSSLPRELGEPALSAPEYYTTRRAVDGSVPCLALLMTTLSFKLLGYGARDAFDPLPRSIQRRTTTS